MKYDKSINRKCNRYDKLEVVSKDLIIEVMVMIYIDEN